MQKILFLDANVYLHYQPFDQIDWLEVAQADTATIVVPPVTIRELNKNKDTHPIARIRKRADAALKVLSRLFDSVACAPLRAGVEIRLEDRDPLVDFTLLQLNREVQDDHLIASILLCRDEEPDANIVLITADTGLTLVAKARRLGLATTRLPDSLKLPEEPDPDQVRIRKLEQELHELRSKCPQLSLVFEDGAQYAKFALPRPVELTQVAIEERIREIRKRYPKMQEQPRQEIQVHGAVDSIADLGASLEALKGLLLENTLLPADIAAYNTKLDEFYDVYAKYLVKAAISQNLGRRSLKVEIWLANDGTAPAEDIDIYMRFPGGFALGRRLPNPPEQPEPPSPPKTPMQKMTESLAGIRVPYFGPYSPTPVVPPGNVSGPSIKRTHSYDVDYHVERIKHGLREPLDPLYVVFESFEGASSFQIEYRILAAELPHEIVGKLHIVVEKPD